MMSGMSNEGSRKRLRRVAIGCWGRGIDRSGLHRQMTKGDDRPVTRSQRGKMTGVSRTLTFAEFHLKTIIPFKFGVLNNPQFWSDWTICRWGGFPNVGFSLSRVSNSWNSSFLSTIKLDHKVVASTRRIASVSVLLLGQTQRSSCKLNLVTKIDNSENAKTVQSYCRVQLSLKRR